MVSSHHVYACAVDHSAICSKNRKIVPYHENSTNTRNGARLRSPSLIMAPDNRPFCSHHAPNECWVLPVLWGAKGQYQWPKWSLAPTPEGLYIAVSFVMSLGNLVMIEKQEKIHLSEVIFCVYSYHLQKIVKESDLSKRVSVQKYKLGQRFFATAPSALFLPTCMISIEDNQALFFVTLHFIPASRNYILNFSYLNFDIRCPGKGKINA